MSKKGWDLTSLHSLESAVEWVRKGSGAFLVLVIRAEDAAFAVAPEIAPEDAVDMVEIVMPEAMKRVNAMRLEARAKAKSRV